MKQLPPFVFIAPQSDAPGAGFVLSTSPPYYYAKVLKWDPRDEFAIVNYVNANNPIVYKQVGEYNLILAFTSSLEGYKIRASDENWKEPLQKLFDSMAAWYLKEKINSNPGYYKRYLIK